MRAWEPLLTVVVPAYNEENGVVTTLQTLRDRLPHSEVILVDDASTDQTCARAETVTGVRVLSHIYNCGYGGALKTGMLAARGAYVAWFDADGEHKVDDLINLVDLLHGEQLTAVIGQRQDRGSSLERTVGKWVIRLLARALRFKGGKDLNCGLRVFRKDIILRYIHVLPDGYSASLTSLMMVLERGFPVAFHPVSLGQRIGESKVKFSDGFASLVLVLRTIMLFAPLRIFFTLGFSLSIIGTSYSVWIAVVRGLGIPVGGALLILIGIVLLSLGLIADQVSQMRLNQLTPADALQSRPIRSFLEEPQRLRKNG